MAKRVKATVSPDFSLPLTAVLLGQAVRARRTQSNLKLADTAALCGVSKQTLNNIEKGVPTTQLNTILQVCAGLGIKLSILPWQSGETDDWY